MNAQLNIEEMEMRLLLSIGEFSKICEVSTKTLRYYDEIGLIHPDEINLENGYRYYSIKQLTTMLFINRLKSYHFSLEEIKDILDREQDQFEEKLCTALNLKKRELQEKLRTYEYTLKQMNNDVQNLEKGISMMSYLNKIEVELVETKPVNILYSRQLLSSDDYALGYGRYFSKLYETIATEKLTLLGTPITIYHSKEYNPAGNDTEFALPIEENVKKTRELPKGLCAKSVSKGPYSELRSVYAKLTEWIEHEGYKLVSSPYEIYLTDPTQTNDPENLVTEVYFPVKRERNNTLIYTKNLVRRSYLYEQKLLAY